jgi:poly-gamma-glutamate capsule biosynthesis protein CapA/YwtB (metallophosphatase superfamily)
MLGRGVAEAIATDGVGNLVAPEVIAITRGADLFVLNLECCISHRGTRWSEPGKPFFFRAPPEAAELLDLLGVDCVTLANNHALDYGRDALLDTLEQLEATGIAWTGAGRDLAGARAAAVTEAGDLRVAVVGCADHPADYAATAREPGIAYADLRHDPLPPWLATAITEADADIVLVTPHWGPNMTTNPPRYVRRSAAALRSAGAALIAGHSAHVFHGAEPGVLYDLGDFLDDYAVDRVLRNDLGLLFVVTLAGTEPVAVEAVPLRLDYCHTRLADGDDAAWIAGRFRAACAAYGADVREVNGRLVIDWSGGPHPERV